MNRFKTVLLAAAIVALPLSAMAQATPAKPATSAQPSAGAPATPATPNQPTKQGKQSHQGKGTSATNKGHRSMQEQKHEGGKMMKKPSGSSSLDDSLNIQLAAAPFFRPVLGLGLN